LRILIVDDEAGLLEQLRQVFSVQKYETDTALDGEMALEKLFANPYDLIILDIMLPKVDGLAVLRELRRQQIKTPVLMLTSKGEIEDKIIGLDHGADDYLAKPFSVAELLARARALLRRGTEHGTAIMSARDLRLNSASREVYKGESPLKLTQKEFSILEFLLYNKNRAVSRFSLAEHVWGDDFDPFTMSNYIDVHIKNLRQKIGDPDGALIETIRAVGYIIKNDAP
jgi:DNA-binding response OmpR family regulator